MDNLALRADTGADLDRLIRDFMDKIATISDPVRLKEAGNAFITRFPPERALEIAGALTFANPFFLPDMPADSARRLSLSLDQFVDMVMRAKLAARHSPQLNILVACAPKSASTFIQNALTRALDLPVGSLFTASLNGSALGANLREQEPDELALIRSGLNRLGYVAQHHVRATPFLARQLALYNVRPVVTLRNVFDTIVSLDDMLVEWRSVAPEAEGHYFDDAMPRHYATMDPADRYRLLAARWPAWLAQFCISWKKVAAQGLAAPFVISYEADFLADKAGLAERLARHLGRNEADSERLHDAFSDRSNGKALRLNQGVAGRGDQLPDALRARIEQVVRAFGAPEDVAPLFAG